MSTKRRSILVAAWAAVVMGLGAVGETAAQEKVTLRLDWVNSGYHADPVRADQDQAGGLRLHHQRFHRSEMNRFLNDFQPQGRNT